MVKSYFFKVVALSYVGCESAVLKGAQSYGAGVKALIVHIQASLGRTVGLCFIYTVALCSLLRSHREYEVRSQTCLTFVELTLLSEETYNSTIKI